MRSPSKTQMSKFFRIWTFILLFLATNTLAKPAWAFRSTVDQCLAKPACAGVIAAELTPVISTPLPTAGGSVPISATTAIGVTTSSEAVAGVAVVEDIRLSGLLGYRIWQLEQNKKAQEKAKQRYCEAYPTDVVCPRQLTGVPYRIIGDIYYESIRVVSVGGYWQTTFAPVVHHIDNIDRFYKPLGPVHAVYLQLKTYPPEYPKLMGYGTQNPQLVERYDWVLYVSSGNPAKVQGWGSGGGYTRPGQPPKLLNLKVYPLNGEQEPPGLPWKDWPQQKRSIAVAALKEPDWQEFIKSMPEGGRLIPGDKLEAPVIVLPGLNTDDPSTPEDDRLPTKKLDFFPNPGRDDFDYDADGIADSADPEPQNPAVPKASDNSSNPPPSDAEEPLDTSQEPRPEPLSSIPETTRARDLAEAKAAELRALPRRERPAANAAAVDKTTGKIYYGNSGEPLPTTIDPFLAERMPNPSLEKWKVANCAEFKAVNDALLNGARIENLEVYTVRTRTSEAYPRCDNCRITTDGANVTSDP